MKSDLMEFSSMVVSLQSRTTCSPANSYWVKKYGTETKKYFFDNLTCYTLLPYNYRYLKWRWSGLKHKVWWEINQHKGKGGVGYKCCVG
jgi:hypothetical protein